MKINHVQERLINELVDYARQKYPEIELGKITESPSSSDHIWVIVKGIDWNDDDKSMDFMEYLAGKQEDILVEYGYPISLMPIFHILTDSGFMNSEPDKPPVPLGF